MSFKKRIPLEEAKRIANIFCSNIQRSCLRLEIVGSIRRECETVGDIELLAESKFQKVYYTNKQKTLFELTESGKEINNINLLSEKIKLMAMDKNIKLIRNGSKYKKIIFNNYQIDLFIAEPKYDNSPSNNYGLLEMIRTGSKEYSKRIVTEIRKKGFKSYNGFLRKYDPVKNEIIGNPVNVIDEDSFYNITNTRFILPKYRTR